MKQLGLLIFVLCIIFNVLLSVVAEEEKFVFKACVQKNSQTNCPGSSDVEFSEKQLLFYRYNKPVALKQAKSFYNKAVHYESQAKLTFARLYYLKAIDIYPYLVEAHINLGGVYICIGEYDSAIVEFEKVLRLSSDYFPSVYINLGLAYEHKNDFVKAKDYYSLATEIDPENVLAHNNLACVCLKIGETQLALQHLKIVSNLAPGFLKDEVMNIIASK